MVTARASVDVHSSDHTNNDSGSFPKQSFPPDGLVAMSRIAYQNLALDYWTGALNRVPKLLCVPLRASDAECRMALGVCLEPASSCSTNATQVRKLAFGRTESVNPKCRTDIRSTVFYRA